MANVCFQMIAFQSDYVLKAVLETILPYGKVVVTEGPVAYWQRQGFTTSTDKTNEILADMVGEENIVHGQWDEKDQMVNASLHLIPKNTTHLWAIDADEVFHRKDIEKILGWLDGWDSVSFKMYSFYGGFERYITGFEENFEVQRIKRWYPGARWETHRPPTVRDEHGVRMRDKRHLPHTLLDDNHGIRFYHYSYVWPAQMFAKACYYDDYDPNGNIPNYFWRVYWPWIAKDEDTREAIEREFKGVHNWLPKRRGPSYTAAFQGEHPEAIRRRLPEYRKRFKAEIEFCAGMMKEPVSWGKL